MCVSDFFSVAAGAKGNPAMVVLGPLQLLVGDGRLKKFKLRF